MSWMTFARGVFYKLLRYLVATPYNRTLSRGSFMTFVKASRLSVFCSDKKIIEQISLDEY